MEQSSMLLQLSCQLWLH
uniref:Rad51a n=1 Tax=Arundo donax TaxID=35708 RepID=A0A0A9E126_ARUDO